MMQTNTEYMSEKDRVERVVQKMMNMTLGELKKAVYGKKYIELIMDEVAPREGLRVEKTKDMRFVEFVRLVYSVGGNPEYDWYEHDSWAEQRFYYRSIASLLTEGGRASIPVKLFLALPLKAFYLYLESVCAHKGRMLAEWEELKEGCAYNEDYTVGDFLTEKIQTANKVWVQIISLKEFEDEVEKAHEDMGALLVDSFVLAFPGSLHTADICRKYGNGAADEAEAAVDEREAGK